MSILKETNTTSPISCQPVFARGDFYLMTHKCMLKEPFVYIKRALCLYEKRPTPPTPI